jgi:1-acyl-sn-glycerol-3-phosphate acyltransferase
MNPLPWLLIIMGLVALVMSVWFFWIVRSTDYTVAQTFFWLLAKFLARFLWRTSIEDPFPLNEESSAVIICNHRSSVDPFFVQVCVRWVVHWMVAREYCEHPVLGFFMRIPEVIPVNRGGIDTAATKSAMRIVADGGMVGMLPEGRINTTEKLLRPVRPGAIVIALKAQAPIIPCYIEGAPYRGSVWSPFFTRARVRVRFGQPIDLSPYYGQEKDSELVHKLLRECVSAIAKLAGEPDFEPELAGRKWKTDELAVDSDRD